MCPGLAAVEIGLGPYLERRELERQEAARRAQKNPDRWPLVAIPWYGISGVVSIGCLLRGQYEAIFIYLVGAVITFPITLLLEAALKEFSALMSRRPKKGNEHYYQFGGRWRKPGLLVQCFTLLEVLMILVLYVCLNSVGILIIIGRLPVYH